MKISKNTEYMKDTMKKLDLIDIYKTLHSITSRCTFFSSARDFSPR